MSGLKRQILLSVTVIVGVAMIAGCKPRGAAGGPGGPGGPGGGMPHIQVVAVEARQQPVSESLSLLGSIAANEMIQIKSEIEGVIQEIRFDEGQPVEKGQLLVRLDDTKLAAAVAEAESNFKLSKANFDRGEQLFRDNLISQQEYDQVAATFDVNQAGLELKRRQLKDTRVSAPFEGIMGARQVSPGQVIEKNTVISWLVDLDPVKVEVNVPERYLSQLKVGRPLEFTVAAFPDEKFHGEVYFISPQVSESLRTVLIKARIPNPGNKLLGGMLATMALTLQIRDAAIVIPEPALMSSGDNFLVFVVDENGAAQMRPVEVGLRLAGKAEILKGLRAGEKVVVEGMQKLRPGAPVKLAPPEAAAAYVSS
jgi:membrane fusion protein, multidrug efflux system